MFGLKFLLQRWKPILVLSVVLLVAYSSYLGIAEQFFAWSLTVYGTVVITRTILQLYFARRNNKMIRDVNRGYIFSAIRNLFSEEEEQHIRRLTRRPLRFDDFRAIVMARIVELLSTSSDPKLVVRYATEGDREKFLHQDADAWWRAIVTESMRLLGEEFRDKPIGGISLEERQTRDVPTTGLMIPMYKTPIEQLQALLVSAENQTWPYKNVVVVINQHDPELQEKVWGLIQEIAHDTSRYAVFMEPRKGKRNAMERGARWLFEQGVDYVCNADSDSKVDLDVNANFIRIAANFGAGCATGDVRVWNDTDNWLARLTAHRYQQAFNIERAAQSWFKAVTCMSGPYLGVEAVLFRKFIDLWVAQYYLGQLCNFGDDRNISTNVMRLGRPSLYNPECIVLTDCPTRLSQWRLQQTRWARSASRETIISLPFMHKLPLWVEFDMAYQFLFSFILLGILLSLISRTIGIGLRYGMDDATISLLPYITIVVGLNWIFKGLYGYLSYKDRWYISSPLYIVLHYFILLPIRLYALVTPRNNEWGTK